METMKLDNLWAIRQDSDHYFGVWHYCAHNHTLTTGIGGHKYYRIVLERIRTNAAMLNTVSWIADKERERGASVVAPDLLRAFEEIFDPQVNLCPGGQDKNLPEDFWKKELSPPEKQYIEFIGEVEDTEICHCIGETTSVTSNPEPYFREAVRSIPTTAADFDADGNPTEEAVMRIADRAMDIVCKADMAEADKTGDYAAADYELNYPVFGRLGIHKMAEEELRAAARGIVIT